MTRAIALALGVALAAVELGCGKYGAPVRYRPAPAMPAMPATEATEATGAAGAGSGAVPAPDQTAPDQAAPGQAAAAEDEEAPPVTPTTPVPAEPRDPILEPAPGWQP
jgi:hypothetical protein